jgi:hypothetical protein
LPNEPARIEKLTWDAASDSTVVARTGEA